MASLFNSGIVALCANMAAGQYNTACNKAMDAGTRQLGWRQSIDQVEDGTVHYVTVKAENNTPKELQDVAGVVVYSYKVAKTKTVNFRLPTLGIADQISNEVTPTSYTVNVKWNVSW